MRIQQHIPTGFDYTPRCKDPSCAGRLTKKFMAREVAEYAWNRRAVKIPPHGRLIDADELAKHTYLLNEHYKYRQVVDIKDLESAPTIIEAEGATE